MQQDSTFIRKDIIFRNLSYLSPSKYISFSNFRLNKKLVLHLLPELKKFDHYFGSKAMSFWIQEQESYRAVIARGLRLGLRPNTHAISDAISSLDLFMIRFHASTIAETLDCLSEFANRLRPSSRPDRTVWMWTVEHSIVITNSRLSELATYLFLALHHLPLCTDASSSHPLQGWPDHSRLVAASQRAIHTYARFLPWPYSAPTSPASASPASLTHVRPAPLELHLNHQESSLQSVPVEQAVLDVDLSTPEAGRAAKRRRMSP